MFADDALPTLASERLALIEHRLASANQESDRLSALIELARTVADSDPPRGVRAARDAVQLARKLGRLQPLGEALDQLSNCLRNNAELNGAAQAARESATVHATLGDTRGEAAAQINLGIALSMVGQPGQALNAFIRARDLSRRLQDVAGEADALMDMALAYTQLGDEGKALSLYEQVIPMYETLADDYHLASSMNNAAHSHISWGLRKKADRRTEARVHFQKAIELIETALPIARRLSNAPLLVSCLDTLSAAYRELDDGQLSLDTLVTQLQHARDAGAKRLEAVTLVSMGSAHRKASDLDAAAQCLEAADHIFTELPRCEQHVQALDQLVLVQESRGDFKAALQAQRRITELQLRLKSDATDEQLRVLEARLELERAESELAMARQREAELAALNAQLNEADRQKSVLLVRLERLTYEDALTGLYNRRSLDQRIAEEFERSRRYGFPLSVALADLDFFKQINDRLSHAIGDEVLRTVARLMREGIRTSDFASRYGGEEFCLLFPETSLVGAERVCEAIRQSVASYDWASIHPDLMVTLSFGVTDSSAAVGSHPQLLDLADRLLYQAKFNGKNQVRAAVDDLAP